MEVCTESEKISSRPPKAPTVDPVAANLNKVIQILNKHNLTEGLDLRYLRDSVGIEQGAGRRIKADPNIDKKHHPGKVDLDKEIQKRIQIRKERNPFQNDGSYLGTYPTSKTHHTEGNGTENQPIFANLKSDSKPFNINQLSKENAITSEALKAEIGDFSDMRGTSSRLSQFDHNLNKVKDLKNSEDLVANGVLSAYNTQPQETRSLEHYEIESADSVKSLDVQRVLDALGSGLEVKEALKCADTMNKKAETKVSSDKKFQKIPPIIATGSGLGLGSVKDDLVIVGCQGNGCDDNNTNNHGNKDLVGDNMGEEYHAGKCCEVKKEEEPDLLGGEDVKTAAPAPPPPKSGVEEFRVFYWKIEMEEWTRINRQLRQHGLPQVELLHPRKAAQTSDIVMLDPETAQTLRHTLQTLMKDCDRRQELVQELILTNNQLSSKSPDEANSRRELGEQTISTEKYETKARELKQQLSTSRSHIEDLEEDRLLHGEPVSNEEKLRNTKNAIQVRCQELQKKVDDQALKINKLQAELDHMKLEEKRMKEKHEDACSKLKKQLPRNARIDDKTLDLIDSYEKQIFSLKKQLEERDNKHAESCSIEEATPNYKSLIKSYEREVRDAKKKIKTLENDNDILQLDLQSRPNLKDYRATQHKVKKMERMLKKNNINPSSSSHYGSKDHLAYSTRVEDLEYLPLTHCQAHLRQVCGVLRVDDLEDIRPTLHQHMRALEAQPRLIEFARDVLDIVNTPGLPVPPEYSNRNHAHGHTHEVWCEKTWHHVIPALRYWCSQIAALKDLQEGLVKLCSMFAPEGSTGLNSSPPSSLKMATAVRGLVADEPNRSNSQSSKGSGSSKDRPSRSVLQGIVDHFMTLFDVARISGVYARMNDLYTKLGEVHNMMKTLRNLLGLSDESRGSAVVEAVARLCRSHTEASMEHLKQMFKVDDLNAILRKLEEHEEFFPAFQEIMSKLMEICNCQRVDQVVPTVRALKLLAG